MFRSCNVLFFGILLCVVSSQGLDTNSSFSSNSSSSIDVPIPLQSNTPTSTPSPTTFSIPPTFKDACYICGSADNPVANESQEVVVDLGEPIGNETLNCGIIQAGGMYRFVSPSLCSTLQLSGCTCTREFVPPTFSPTTSFPPTSSATTYIPTVSFRPSLTVVTYEPSLTPFPSVTSYPTLTTASTCNICDYFDASTGDLVKGGTLAQARNNSSTTSESGNSTSLENSTVLETLALQRRLFTCDELNRKAMERRLPVEFCKFVQVRIRQVAVNGTTNPLETGCTCVYSSPSSKSVPTTTTLNNTTNDKVPTASATATSASSSLLKSSTFLTKLRYGKSFFGSVCASSAICTVALLILWCS